MGVGGGGVKQTMQYKSEVPQIQIDQKKKNEGKD